MSTVSHVLIIDDNPLNIQLATMVLRSEGYKKIDGISNPEQAVPWICENMPDVILLDISMPGISGLEVLQQLKNIKATSEIPVLMLTSQDDNDTKRRAFELGAQDYVTKPFNSYELIARVNNIVRLKLNTDQLKHQNILLEEKVQERTREIIRSLGRAAEFKDNETGEHVLRVSVYSAIIAAGLNFKPDKIDLILQATPMHDIGKIGIPDSILLKPDKLSDEERKIMEQHCIIGAEIFLSLEDKKRAMRNGKTSHLVLLEQEESPLLKTAATIALTHHERWDGTGYPLGLKGDEIPIEGRIVAVADVFDALNSKRPYKDAFPIKKSWKIIHDLSGTHFDPRVVDEFMNFMELITEIQLLYAEKIGAKNSAHHSGSAR
ncbi:response regulator [bacterium]|nr:response regulator [bacterium]MCP5462292.1 response regulator [bacterium]